MIGMTTVHTECPLCWQSRDFVLDADRLGEWRAGALIQQCFPEMLPDDREQLVSGVCVECWATLDEE